MQVICGLGNPGVEYDRTRHNAGFWFADRIVNRFGTVAVNPWKEKWGALIADCSIAGEAVKVVKPQSFMNLSGEPLSRVLSFYKFSPEDMLVAYDEADLDSGRIQLRNQGGHAGHNGLKSIMQQTGSREFFRLRIGVGRPGEEKPGMELSSWVLGRVSSEEEVRIDQALEKGLEGVTVLVRDGFKKAQGVINC